MDGEDFHLHWEDGVKWEVKQSPTSEHSETGVICGIENVQDAYNDMQSSEVEIPNTDQMAAENLIFLAQDVNYTVNAELVEDPSVECVTEEVITDDWVITGGQERVEVPLEHLANAVLDSKEDNDIDVPLPTDQDEYTARRPWPCDFCSRRFRKKAALMNHMVAHQNDRPHACNLCGVQYVRKCDLINHLKVHAFVPTDQDGIDYEQFMETSQVVKPKKKRGRRKKVSEPTDESAWENMTSARTQQWSRRARSPKPPPAPLSPSLPPSEPPSPPPPSPPPVPSDPSRPFVCKHCGVGFAREKALQSHSRVHGGDSPVECSACGELCWSREALSVHARLRHPHLAVRRHANYEPVDDSDADADYRASPDSGSERAYHPPYPAARPPDLFCQDCGVAFQRADLLRRHQAAAHSHKRERSEGSGAAWGAGEHACDVCGEVCADALQLLAHAERHADRNHAVVGRLKKGSRGRTASGSSHSRQFPCRECGKVFGSRSSQQIHVRIHTGERPYACRFCWKAFADGGTLRKHERIHTGEKPYACAVCPRAFNQRVVLREHVRSHHSAPTKRPNGMSSTYVCVVCGRTQHTSTELVQHLIQHCDINTALKRQPQPGPRKYKRRRKLKSEISEAMSPETCSWERPSPPPATPPPPPPPVVGGSVARTPRRRRRVAPAAPPVQLRSKMIHTEEQPRSRLAKQLAKRGKRPSRRPADDLRAIRNPRVEPMEAEVKAETEVKAEADAGGPYKCEMCSLEFSRRDALLLHVPVHI